MNDFNKQKGFSLVELGMSLSIIAMVIAAVVAGANLKEKFELNQAMEDIGNINSAVTEFKDIYNGYPGDMFDAEDKLGSTETNSGNGNNAIEASATGTIDGTAGAVNEQTLFWQHLAISGLIEGSYDGATEFMKAPISKGIYTVSKTSTGGLLILLERARTIVTGLPRGILTTKQSWEIDTKFDDGIPTTGVIQAQDGDGETAQDCVNTTTTPASYKLSNTGEAPCVLIFLVE
ncbi:MAG: type II secretion system protein [Rickettsiales bacterium]|nr:type II secretion system protein [Pseudomonadota bacterium]MDA0967274.1 type II secretion system protein [Pseudomonadota bacterium]MDG4544065.1 type II secretion system protein [Rickettsiales bacterium]MDG4546241.1 type II secretion system protein [Rickettsiales bacterium]MDG4548389.1 type II secretion system protein [Rickettsiales bacterium]